MNDGRSCHYLINPKFCDTVEVNCNYRLCTNNDDILLSMIFTSHKFLMKDMHHLQGSGKISSVKKQASVINTYIIC